MSKWLHEELTRIDSYEGDWIQVNDYCVIHKDAARNIVTTTDEAWKAVARALERDLFGGKETFGPGH